MTGLDQVNGGPSGPLAEHVPLLHQREGVRRVAEAVGDEAHAAPRSNTLSRAVRTVKLKQSCRVHVLSKRNFDNYLRRRHCGAAWSFRVMRRSAIDHAFNHEIRLSIYIAKKKESSKARSACPNIIH